MRAAKVKAIRNDQLETIGYGAVLYDLAGDYHPDNEVKDKVFHIEVDLDGVESPEKLGLKSLKYDFVERFRFSINTLAGQFEIINGAPISLEEALVKQFPCHYSDLVNALEPAQKSDHPPTIPKGYESFYTSLKANQGVLKSSADVLGSDHSFGSVKVLGKLLYDSQQNDPLYQESVNLAFGIFDTTGKISKLTKDLSEAGMQAPASLLRADGVAKMVNVVPDTIKNVWDKGVVDNLSTISIPPKLESIGKSAFKVANKVAGPVGTALDAFATMETIKGAYGKFEKIGENQQGMEQLFSQYANLVEMQSMYADPGEVSKLEEKFKKLAAQFKTTMQYSRVDDAIYLNVRFPFDKARFSPDNSFSDFVELVKSLKGDVEIELAGHTCDLGSNKYNNNLSRDRAQAVEKKLQAENIPDNVTLNAVGYGESNPLVDNINEINRSKNRRVEAVIGIKKHTFHHPSREGMDAIEKVRHLSTVNLVGLDADVKAAIVASINLVLGLLPLNPVSGMANIVMAVGNLALDGYSWLQKAMYGEAFMETLGKYQQMSLDSTANQTFLLKGLQDNESYDASDYLHHQARLRSEALYGLMRLLMRCSIETDWQKRDKTSDDLIFFDFLHGPRSDFSYTSNLEYYRVEDYVKTFLLSDNWQLSLHPIFAVSLDEYWIYLIQTGQVDKIPPTEEKQQSIREMIAEQAEAALATITKAAKIIDDSIDAGSQLAMHPILGANYFSRNVGSALGEHRQYASKADFQRCLPIQHMASEDFQHFTDLYRADYSRLDKSIYLYNSISVRPRGAKGVNDWKPMDQWLKDHQHVGPYDQIRICVLLDTSSKEVSDLLFDDNGNPRSSAVMIPAQAQPVRRDGSNYMGPPEKTFVKKISEADLLAHENAAFKAADKANKGIYGVIFNPKYMLGNNTIFGTKPMASAIWTALNVTSENRINYFYNWDGQWDMLYAYEVLLGNNSATNISVEYKTEESEFPYALDTSREYSIKNSKGISAILQDESRLLNSHFLKIGKERESYPQLFDSPNVFCLARYGNETDYQLSEENWPYNKKDSGGYLDVFGFDPYEVELAEYTWDKPMELIVLVVSDELKTDAYDDGNIDWKKIPAALQLINTRSDSEQDTGPTYSTSLRYIGDLARSQNPGTVYFSWKDNVKDSLTEGTRPLLGYLEKQKCCEILSGMDAASGIWEGLWQGEMQDNRKHLYMAHIKLDYQGVTGLMRKGMKPFGADIKKPIVDNKVKENQPIEIKKNRQLPPDDRWRFSAKITSHGDSGLSGSDVTGYYSLPWPTGFNNAKSHWYDGDKLCNDLYTISHEIQASLPNNRNNPCCKAAENLELNKVRSKHNQSVSEQGHHLATLPITPLMKWIALGDDLFSQKEFLNSERQEYLLDWMQKDGNKRCLGTTDHFAMQTPDEEAADLEKI